MFWKRDVISGYSATTRRQRVVEYCGFRTKLSPSTYKVPPSGTLSVQVETYQLTWSANLLLSHRSLPLLPTLALPPVNLKATKPIFFDQCRFHFLTSIVPPLCIRSSMLKCTMPHSSNKPSQRNRLPYTEGHTLLHSVHPCTINKRTNKDIRLRPTPRYVDGSHRF